MNSFIKNNKQFFSLVLGVLLSSSLHAMKINNKLLDSIVPCGEAFSSTSIKKDTLILLEMESGNLNLTRHDINKLGNLKEVSEKVLTNRSDAGTIRAGTICNISSPIIIDNAGYLIGGERLDIQAEISLDSINTRFESPLISITGNTMNFKDSFLINPQILNIIGDYPESDYKAIQIIFHNQPEKPTLITGKIDLTDNQTTQKLIISNVKEITIQFNPHAWLVNKLSKIKKESSALILFFCLYVFSIAVVGSQT